MASRAKLILYTNLGCPWAHRAHIALMELDIPFEQVLIDLEVPRSPEYLKINPSGQVPALVYDGEIVRDSGTISQFLADAWPSHLVRPSGSLEGAFHRARITAFVDAYLSKFQGQVMKALVARTQTETNHAIEGALLDLGKWVEPLLHDSKPFFGGSEKLTLAEVLTASFVIRTYCFSRHGVLPENLPTLLSEKTPKFAKWAEAVMQHPSVASTFDEAIVVQGVNKMRAKYRSL
ncbi:thioredoxin-like protein [Dactylonectria macrodidyma]|uniref:Thioredoxin-like protein n=1 Tax=Dactylonectria macrodidyma TaxID=307937 RepID=A0A9P9DNC7_9HYPO|nr:thioredoxin-like protein [Dactylonectria macrodidyma]